MTRCTFLRPVRTPLLPAPPPTVPARVIPAFHALRSALAALAVLAVLCGPPVVQAESLLGNEGEGDALISLGGEATPPATDDAAEPDDRDTVLAASVYRGPQGVRPAPRPEGRPLHLYRNAMVDSLIRYFTDEKRDVLERGWRRSGRYLAMIRRVFREEGVPETLAYLAAVESNFNPQARSPARAVGMWQFTAPTARTFGLRMHRPWYDERLDPESSTHAAARLLGYLFDRYGNWELALAAYNAGEARVNEGLERARRYGTPEDYWNLHLPRQTQGFVPAFLAIATIMESPADFGLDAVERDAPIESEGLELALGATLDDLAERLELPAEELTRRNPAWRSGLVPPFELGDVLLWVPPGTGPRLMASLAERPPKAIPWLVHRVTEGETVSQIALRYGVRTRDVLALNSLHWHSRLDIGQRLLVPVAADAAERFAAADAAAAADYEPVAAATPAVTQMLLHRVQSGESLWSIARQYGVRMGQLRLWNQLVGQVLQPNQELVLYLPADWAAAP